MRCTTVLGLTFVLAVHSVAAQDTTRFGDDARRTVLRSRAAVAHAARDAARSLILRANIRTTAENGGPLDGTIAIKVLLPDSFLRVETYGTVPAVPGRFRQVVADRVPRGQSFRIAAGEKAVPQMLGARGRISRG
jgi:hypothetical protein